MVNVGPDGLLGPNPITGINDDTGYDSAYIWVIDQSGNASNPLAAGARVNFAIDTTGPKITSSTPVAGGSASVSGNQVTVTLETNENLDPASLNSTSIVAVRAGGDNTFGNGNDVQLQVQLPLNPISQVPGSTTGAQRITFTIVGASANDLYRVTLLGTGANPVRDIAQNALDGDNDNAPGGDYNLDFVVFNPTNAKTIYVDAGVPKDPMAPGTGTRNDPVATIDGFTDPGPDAMLGTADDVDVPGGLDLAQPGDTVAVLEGNSLFGNSAQAVYRESITLKSLVKLVSASRSSSGTNVIPTNPLNVVLAPPAGAARNVAVTGTDLLSQPNFQTEFSGFTVLIPLLGSVGFGQTIDSSSIGISLTNSDVLIDRNYVLNAGFGISVSESGANAGAPRGSRTTSWWATTTACWSATPSPVRGSRRSRTTCPCRSSTTRSPSTRIPGCWA